MISLHELPIEFIYRILDHLDEFHILCSMKNISLRLNKIIDTYPRYQVNFIGIFLSTLIFYRNLLHGKFVTKNLMI